MRVCRSGPSLPCYNIVMYHFAWADQRERWGPYKSDVSLGGGMQMICTLGGDAALYIGTMGPLLIVGLNLLIILN